MLAYTVPSQVPWIVTFIMFLIGGGGLISWFRLKAENARVMASVKSSETSDEVKVTKSVQERYDKLFDDLQTEVTSLRVREDECRVTLDHTLKTMAELRFVAVNAQTSVTLLQDRLDRLESKAPQDRQDTVKEVMKQLGVSGPEQHT